MQDENYKSDEQIEWEEIVYNAQKEHDKELVKKEPIEKFFDGIFFWTKQILIGICVIALVFFFLMFMRPVGNLDF